VDLPAIKLPKLELLNVSDNKLEKFENWVGHPTLRIFKAMDNKFKNLNVLKEMPKLEEAYLANNPISTLSGWENIPNLKKLHLRKTKIEKIDDELPVLENLQYINLRGNKIGTFEMVTKFFQFPALTDINVLGNPVIKKATSINLILADLLIINNKIVRFCKIKIEDQHRFEAIHLANYRWLKSEEERKAREKAEKEKEEAENES
jgi:Leucine-rich repeat (LRR) protein